MSSMRCKLSEKAGDNGTLGGSPFLTEMMEREMSASSAPIGLWKKTVALAWMGEERFASALMLYYR